jgi:hypothetical protein
MAKGTLLSKAMNTEYQRSYLSYWEVVSDVLEVVVNMGGSGHSICLGSYRVKVKLNRDFPHLAPIMVKRVNFFYKVVQKFCPNCFKPHSKKNCHSKKVGSAMLLILLLV